MPRLSKLSRSIAGEVAIVTGAASGMGRATAQLFADEGAKVAAIDLNGKDLEKVVGEIGAAGGTARGWTLDLSDRAAIDRVFAEIAAHFGGDVRCHGVASAVFSVSSIIANATVMSLSTASERHGSCSRNSVRCRRVVASSGVTPSISVPPARSTMMQKSTMSSSASVASASLAPSVRPPPSRKTTCERTSSARVENSSASARSSSASALEPRHFRRSRSSIVCLGFD